MQNVVNVESILRLASGIDVEFPVIRIIIKFIITQASKKGFHFQHLIVCAKTLTILIYFAAEAWRHALRRLKAVSRKRADFAE